MQKIKHFIESDKGKDILTILIVILVGVGSFELGRLSKVSEKGGITLEYIDQEANVLSAIEPAVELSESPKISVKEVSKPQVKPSKQSVTSVGKVYFASSRGSKYYHIGCSGGKTLKPENKIYFSTAGEAEVAGYELSSTCK